ncbi:hypothetical protein BHE74_00052211 [Ensete ventricosum]|nr:hypothetical protein GW17_00034291 [Ensete ventricosum]RWW42257.1 hypothetical protein BHE74_00052211 [Ensete ventricosum]RZS04487.1 hypothetical protein BHM03_00034824 [Ensete ventricosum]
MQWNLAGSSLECWEHAERSPKEDRRTHHKNAEDCQIKREVVATGYQRLNHLGLVGISHVPGFRAVDDG